ncbi:MAG: PfkB family carbohydrate kinase [Melioribacteraceae bacterium]
MIGTGGIGSGKFFLLNGDHTLGREESRSGYILDRNDYCKLHIISHYVKSLLGEEFTVVPIGSIGNDDIGIKVLQEMNEIGLITSYVTTEPSKPTLFSFCFLYPDNSGGNMTTDDSACSIVNEFSITNAKAEFINFTDKGIVLAVPEVPLKAREALLKFGTDYNFFRTASFTSEEMNSVMNSTILENVDLISINLDEAAHAINLDTDKTDPMKIVNECMLAFRRINQNLKISITHGKSGSWILDSSDISHLPSLDLEVVNTAGAGDAFFSGIISGIVAGLSLKESQQLGTLVGGASVTSPHTINKNIDRNILNELAKKAPFTISSNIFNLLEV